MLKGGTKSFGVVFMHVQQLEVLAILRGGGGKSFRSLEGEARTILPSLEGGAKSFGPVIFQCCSPLPPRNQ